jgi:DNA-binding winged helix-turn-helix (wHTH) protein
MNKLGSGPRPPVSDCRTETLERRRPIDSACDGAVYAFDDYVFDASSGRLFHRGAPRALEPKVASFLAFMFANAGRLVRRDELRASLWPERSATDDALNYVVSRARQALSHCSRPAFVLCRGAGYRLSIEPTAAKHAAETPALLDRRTESSELNRLLAACRANRSAKLVLVRGAPGIGKSALIQRLIRDAGSSGYRVARGHCLQASSQLLLWPWQAILHELCPHSEPQPAGAHDFFNAVRTQLARLGADTGLLIALEDIHWADDASLALLEFLSVQLVATPVLLLATCRTPVPVTRKQQLDSVARCARVLSLAPLSTAGARRLLHLTLDNPVEHRAERELLDISEGNPLVLLAAARVMADARAELDLGALLRSPSACCDAVRFQLSGIDSDSEALLTTGAVIGVEFDARVLSLVSGLTLASVMRGLSGPVALELVRRNTETEYRFVQRLCREYLQRGVLDVERRSLQWRIGKALQHLRYDETPSGLASVAAHLSEGAISDLQASEAARVMRRSADSLLRQGALESASRAYTQAFQLASRGGWSRARRLSMALLAERALRGAGRFNRRRGCRKRRWSSLVPTTTPAAPPKWRTSLGALRCLGPPASRKHRQRPSRAATSVKSTFGNACPSRATYTTVVFSAAS